MTNDIFRLMGNHIKDREYIQDVSTMLLLEELAFRLSDAPINNPIGLLTEHGWIYVKLQEDPDGD